MTAFFGRVRDGTVITVTISWGAIKDVMTWGIDAPKRIIRDVIAARRKSGKETK